MRRSIIALAVAGAWAAAVVGGASAQHHGHGQKGHDERAAGVEDTRVAVPIPPQLATHMLANMRDHLAALQEISAALAQGQAGAAAKIAEERLGLSSLRAHGAHEVAQFMPQGMKDAGTAMHRSASRFALDAQNADVTGDLKPALGTLSEVMTACVACHAGYRLK